MFACDEHAFNSNVSRSAGIPGMGALLTAFSLLQSMYTRVLDRLRAT